MSNTRRGFLKSLAAAGVLGSNGLRAAGATETPPRSAPRTGDEDRAIWCALLARIATPMLDALARRKLKTEMPIEAMLPERRAPHMHLEAVGRLLAGLAPWIELPADDTPEGRERARFAGLARMALAATTDPTSPDFVNFSQGRQPVVDAAFLAQSLLRAPSELWKKTDPRVRANIVAALKSSRPIKPGESNWLLFAAIIEAFLHRVGEQRDEARLFGALRKFQQWYVGDGWYGDGPEFHTDYYNAFVIHPMLVETLDVVGDEAPEWVAFRAKAQERFTRFAATQERMIAPDGSFPVLGRSIAYRGGAFQGLALAGLRRQLPAGMKPAQARVALTAVIRRTLEAPGTFDDRGWLRIGLAGHQPGLGENYISTGSLYLCSVVFLPLGLPASDPFWSEPAAPTTWAKAWSGVDLPADKAIKSPK